MTVNKTRLRSGFLSVLLSVNLIGGFLAMAPEALAKSTPSVSVSCSSNPVNVHSATTCTATVSGNGHDSLDNITVTFSSNGTGAFNPSNGQCSLNGNDDSANCHVTYTASLVGTGTHTITGSFAGNSHYNSTLGIRSLTVNKLTATVTGLTASNKAYDGNTIATLNTGSAALSGVTGGDSVTLNTGSASGSFSSKNIGTGKTVTVTGLTISGTASGNYNLTQPSTTANITAKALTVTGITASDKVYDAGTSAVLSTGAAALSGVVAGDSVTLNTGSATGAFTSKTIGSGKTVNVSGLTIGGSGAGNYTLTQPTTAANITAKGLTITGVTANNKVYDATTDATLGGSVSLSGVIAGDTVVAGGTPVASFADKIVATGKSVTVSGYTLDGADAGNYSLTQPSLTADITQKPLTITATGISKIYDSSTSATVSLSTDKLGEDDVTPAGTATFADANVGTDKTVIASGFSLSGADAGNYSIANSTANTTANITQNSASIALDKSNLTRQYNGASQSVGVNSTDPAELTYAVTYNGSTDAPTAVGSYTVVATVTDPNYAGSDTTTLEITAVPLTISGVTAANKVYDHTINATLDTGSAALVGVVGSDDVAISGTAVGTFADKNVGSAKTVTISGFALSGSTAGNYSLTQPSASADITAAQLTVTGVVANDKTYDGNTSATINKDAAALSGVLGEDGVTLSSGESSAVFTNKNAGEGKAVTISGFTISGDDSGNYMLTQPSVTANINAKTLTATASAASKVYDGMTGTTATLSSDKLEGDDVSLTYINADFDTMNVGEEKTVTVSYLSASGEDANNYILASTSTMATANITPRSITITADNISKVYGDTDPALTYQITSGSLVRGDTITNSLSRSVGETVGNYSINQGKTSAGGNYNLTFVPGTFTITIGSQNTSTVLSTTSSEGGPVSGTVPTETTQTVDLSGGSMSINIPAGTVVSGPAGWDGTFAMPSATTTFVAPTPDSGNTASVVSAVSIGAGSTPLTLSKAVRIVFAGQAGKLVGWSQGTTFTQITDICSADSQTAGDSLTAGGDCKIDSGADLVVWTKHFTSYVTYTQQAIVVADPDKRDGGRYGGGAVPNHREDDNKPASKPVITDKKPVEKDKDNKSAPKKPEVKKDDSKKVAVNTPKPKTSEIAEGHSSSTNPNLAAVGQIGPKKMDDVKKPGFFSSIFGWLFGKK